VFPGYTLVCDLLAVHGFQILWDFGDVYASLPYLSTGLLLFLMFLLVSSALINLYNQILVIVKNDV